MQKRLVPGHHDSHENPYKQWGGTLMIRDYHQYPLYENGMFPVCLPSIPYQESDLVSIVENCDGIVIFGGHDIDPLLYGEELQSQGQRYEIRDQNELLLVQVAIKLKKKVFGICRGMQIINVALGGSLYQDITQQLDTDLVHMQHRSDVKKASHQIAIERESFLFDALEESTTWVNSYHHQAIKTLGNNLKAVAHSSDGIIEAIQHEHLPICGVEWHPEFDYTVNKDSRKIFAWLLHWS